MSYYVPLNLDKFEFKKEQELKLTKCIDMFHVSIAIYWF